jgi:predicted adenylyl cyclase CyaB
MPKNLEFKSPISTLRSAVAASKRLRAQRIGKLNHIDTYFKVKKGRLKLREIDGKKFELIYYHRKNLKGSRYSDYIIVPLEEVKPMKILCESLLGVKTVVKKSRILFLYKNARIHIDAVKGLGTFVEFEVLVTQGKRQARRLMDFLILEFGLSEQASVAGSYSDLILKQ